MVIEFLFLHIEAKTKFKISFVKKKRNKKVIVCKRKR